MKKVQLLLSIIAVLVDYGMLVLAGLAAYAVRYAESVQNVRPVIFDLPQSQYISIVLVVAASWIIVFALTGLYTTTYAQRITRELVRIFVGCSFGFLGIITFLFWSRELFSSRFIMLAAWGFAITFVFFGRILLRIIRRVLLKKNIGVTTVILLGHSHTRNLLHSLSSEQTFAEFRIVGEFDEYNEQTLQAYISTHSIDAIVITDPAITRATRVLVHDFCIQHHLDFHYTADVFDAQAHNVIMHTIAGVPLVSIKKTRLEGWGRVYKRLFDLGVSAGLLLILSPVLLSIAVAITVNSKGPIIYKNERVGKNGTLFFVYKFRYLRLEYCTGDTYDQDGKAAEYEQQLIAQQNNRSGGLYKIPKDPRKTSVGIFLERWSLDELPQLYNVLIGNMSMVGPRPHQQREVAQFPKNHERVQAIKPGITGLAQISGRSDLSVQEELRLDTLYIENWSILYDLYILFKTPLALIRPRQNT